MEKQSDDRIIKSTELKEELSKLPKQQGFSTGYEGLDFYLRDFREGDLVILTGVSGHGKTAFATSLTKKFIEQEINPLWFSYEISSSELFERFGEELPIFYLPRLNSSKSYSWIEKKIVEGKRKFGVKAVFIDHLHYLTDDVSVRNRQLPEILANMCRNLKILARRERLIIFAIAHTRKLKSEKTRPTMEDIKDASGIAQEADTVLIIQRKGKQRTKKESLGDGFIETSTDCVLWIDKNRRTGRLGNILMEFSFDDAIHIEK